MVVASSCLVFRALITQAQIWESLRVQNSKSLLYLPIPSSAETWKIVTKKRCVHFSSLKLNVLSEKNPYFVKHLFAKQELITRARLRGQDFATGKNFSFNQSHTKSFAFFSRESYYKSNRKLFSCVCIAWYKHERRWENSRQLCKPSNSPNPSRVYIRLCKHGKRFLLLKYELCILRFSAIQPSEHHYNSYVSYYFNYIAVS